MNMENKKTGLKSIILLILFGAGIIFAMVMSQGNPLTKIKLKKESYRYISANYPDIAPKVTLQKNGVYYISTQDGYQWFVYYENPDDIYMYFCMIYNKDKELIFDGCAENYLKGGTISERLSTEYEGMIGKIHTEEYFNGMPYGSISLSSLMSKPHMDAYLESAPPAPNEGYSGPVFDVTKEYTVDELAKDYGKIAFYYPEDEKTNRQLYQRRLEVRNIAEKYNMPFKTITIAFTMLNGAYDLTYEDLFSDNLEQIIREKHIDYIAQAGENK